MHAQTDPQHQKQHKAETKALVPELYQCYWRQITEIQNLYQLSLVSLSQIPDLLPVVYTGTIDNNTSLTKSQLYSVFLWEREASVVNEAEVQ